MNKTEQGELISAMVDGSLQAGDIERGLQAMEGDPQGQFTWDTYHLIGDILRSPDLATASSSAAFLARLRPALAQEDLDAPAATLQQPLPAAPVRRAEAANDGTYRWKIAAGLASVAAVLAVTWNIVGVAPGVPAGAQLATAPAQPAAAVLASGERNVMLRDARLDELLAAHRQFGSPTAIPMPSGALRNAAFESPAR